MAALGILFLVGPVLLVPIWWWLLPTTSTPAAARLFAWCRVAAVPTGILLAVAFTQAPGTVAGILAVPWLGLASLGALAALVDAAAGLRDGRTLRPGTQHVRWAALAFLAVSAGNALADRLGVQPFGFSSTIILLTAIHFTFAGFVLVLAGAVAIERRPSRLAVVGIALVIVGIPVTAVGFFGVALAAWVGALLVSSGGLAVGLATLRLAADLRTTAARWLVRLAGVTLLLSMPLAIVYATGIWLGTAWLDLPTMARTHGILNVLGFAVPVTLAWALDRRAGRTLGGEA